MMIDQYNNAQPLATSQHPQSFSRDGRAHYWISGESKDELILDIQAIQSLSIQSSAVGDIEVFVSNYPYRKVDISARNEYLTQPTTPTSVPKEEYITPNPDTVWTSFGLNTAEIVHINTASLAQMKIVMQESTTIHIQETDEINDTTGLDNAPSAAVKVDLTPVVDAINNQDDTEFLLIEDADSAGDFYYSQWTTDTSGTKTLQYYDMTGAPVTAPTNPVPVNSTDYEILKLCKQVVNPFGAYNIGDKITQITILGLPTGAALSTLYIDASGNFITLNPSDITDCASEKDWEAVQLCDVVEEKITAECTPSGVGTNMLTLIDTTGFIGIDAAEQILWDFGDGTYTEGAVVTHDYTGKPANTYQITHRVETNFGHIFSSIFTIDWDGDVITAINYTEGYTTVCEISVGQCYAHTLQDGTITGIYDGLGNPYTPTGTLQNHCPKAIKKEFPWSTTPYYTSPTEVREYINEQLINFTDAVTFSLTIPTDANHAELQIIGGDVLWGYGNNTKVLRNESYLELESLSELQNFSCIGGAGQSGQVVVHYFSVPKTPLANA